MTTEIGESSANFVTLIFSFKTLSKINIYFYFLFKSQITRTINIYLSIYSSLYPRVYSSTYLSVYHQLSLHPGVRTNQRQRSLNLLHKVAKIDHTNSSFLRLINPPNPPPHLQDPHINPATKQGAKEMIGTRKLFAEVGQGKQGGIH